MRSLNNIDRITLQGVEVKNIDKTHKDESKSKQTSLATESVLKNILENIESKDCTFDFNKHNELSKLTGQVEIDNSKTFYGTTVSVNEDEKSFVYTADSVSTATTEEVYLSPVVTEKDVKYIVNNGKSVKIQRYNYPVSDNYDSAIQVTLKPLPYKKIYLPKLLEGDVYLVPASTFVIGESYSPHKIYLWESNSWEKFFRDSSCTIPFELDVDYKKISQNTSRNEYMCEVLSDIYYKPTSRVDCGIDLCVDIKTSSTVYKISGTGTTTTEFGTYFFYNDTRKPIYKITNLEQLSESPTICNFVYTIPTSGDQSVTIRLPLYNSSKPNAVYKIALFDNNVDDGVLYHACDLTSVKTDLSSGYMTHGYYTTTATAVFSNTFLDPKCTVQFSSTENFTDHFFSEREAINSTYYRKYIIREFYYRPPSTATTVSQTYVFTGANMSNHSIGYYKKRQAGISTYPVYEVLSVGEETTNISTITSVPDVVKKITVSKDVKVRFNVARTEPLSIIYDNLNADNCPQNVPNGKFFIKCTHDEFGIMPSLVADELHITARFFNDASLDDAVSGDFGAWGNVSFNKLFVDTTDLNTSKTEVELISTIARVLLIDPSKINLV